MPTPDLTTRIAQTRGALARYRVAALVTGVFLLVLCVEMIVKYVLRAPDSVLVWIRWIPFAHGWIYVLYLVTVVDLWAKMRWSLGRLLTMVVAGVVPVMSFILEKKVHAEATELLDGASRAVAAGHEDAARTPAS